MERASMLDGRRDDTVAVVRSVLDRIPQTKIAVVGDFCLDAYWELDESEPELSLETGLVVRRVASQRYQLGGAGNVAANLCALGVGSVRVVGHVGEDPFGRTVLRLLTELGVDARGLRSLPAQATAVYIKPLSAGVEQGRIDLRAGRAATPGEIGLLVTDLRAAAMWADVVLVNQQLTDSTQEAVVDAVNAIAAAPDGPVVVLDSRESAQQFHNVILKLNTAEAARMCSELGVEPGSDQDCVRLLSRRSGQPVFLTRGPRGILAASDETVWQIPGIEVPGQIDTVGAGDTVLAAIGAALAAGATPAHGATFANVAASVVVAKQRTTGTAGPAEVIRAAAGVAYSYAPELAEDSLRARQPRPGGVEQVTALPTPLHIRHVVFDHDGTLSSLREGWEDVMEALMEQAILGPDAASAPSAVTQQVHQSIRRLIATTTGAPTILQMEGLTRLVREYGRVSGADVGSSSAYKAQYNELLSAMVADRIARIHDGRLSAEDYQIKGARRFLEQLSARGIRLYLASGTDTDAVRTDAAALGYDHLFEGRISGATNDPHHDAKRIVMDAIVADLPPGETFAVFGDGPVELREARRRGGIAIGVCSDERRRHGFNPDKRARLIRAGGDLLIGDYSQPQALLDLLEM